MTDKPDTSTRREILGGAAIATGMAALAAGNLTPAAARHAGSLGGDFGESGLTRIAP
jgi:hypothetical protein